MPHFSEKHRFRVTTTARKKVCFWVYNKYVHSITEGNATRDKNFYDIIMRIGTAFGT